jgi:hypothetical protein
MWVGDGQDSLQAACERGQEQLIATDYLSAAATLAGAEATAWEAEDFDTLARLYMPLQEARRQIRLRCGEGAVGMATAGPDADLDAIANLILDRTPQGLLLVMGFGSVAAAARVRRRAAERRAYVEVLMAAGYAVETGEHTGEGAVVIVPTVDAQLPTPGVRRYLAELTAALPPGCFVDDLVDFPHALRGTPETFAAVSARWERLHAPFLAMAEAEPDPLRRMAAFRRTIEVDPACELAHQHLSNTARDLARQLARRRG